jgi:hypothetical protein
MINPFISRTSTNSSSWLHRILSLETIADDILEDLNTISDLLRKDQDSNRWKLEFLLGSMHDPSQRPGLVKFLRNAILLFLGLFPRNYILEEALLITTTYSVKENSLPTPSNASRALAKNLLKRDRQVLFFDFLFACITLFWSATC